MPGLAAEHLGQLPPPPPAPGAAARRRGLDPATGGVALAATDVYIPGALPLLLVRHYRAGTKAGRRFGKGWGSTLDQCLVLRPDGVRLIAEDGRVLDYPVPGPAAAVLPTAGPRWPLTWDGRPGGTMTVRRPETGHSLHYRPVPGAAGAELPLVEVTDGRGNAVRLAYDGGAPAEVAHSDGHRVGVTSRDGRVAELRLLSDPAGPLLRRFGYDAAGNLLAAESAEGPVERLEYDARRRLTGRARGTEGWYRYAYDASGRVVRAGAEDGRAAAVLAYDDAERTTRLTDSLGHTTVYTFDEAGRPVAETDPLGHTTRREWGPHGGLVALTDPLGRVTRWERDAHGAVTAVTLPDGTVAARPEEPAEPPLEPPVEVPGGKPGEDGLRREHDAEGRLTGLADAEGNSWTYTYDAAGRLIGEADTAGRALRHRYDAAGQHVGWTNGAGQRVSHTLDGCGRLIEQRTDSGIARFRYDAAGRLIAAANEETELTWERDASSGAVIAETCNGRTMRYAHDAQGRRTERHTPSGAVTRWEYDAAGRPAALHAGPGSLAFAYDAAGREIARRLGDAGPVLRQEWDAAGRPAALVLPAGLRRTFHYREDGAPVRVADPAVGVLDITLDTAGRVLAVHGPGGTQKFGQDAEGGLAGATGNHRYDGQGRVVKAGRLGLSWDALDRLTDVVTAEGRHWHYVYDPLGRRVAKQLLDDYGAVVTETTYAWEGTKPAEERRPDGTATVWHWAPAGHRPLAQTTHAPEGAAVWHAAVTDPLGTPTELLGADGTVVWRRRASFWGAPDPAGAAGTEDTAECRLGFPGQLLDPETGLYYHLRRYYDPAAACYLSPDPRRVGPAPYAYVAHPLRDSAPEGLPGGGPWPGPRGWLDLLHAVAGTGAGAADPHAGRRG
ncbi:DUF6531 domain-containing protein [Streptomyces sp. MP131-18]|uniref:DUF6531 domain-containing protein n=1 Tax=Streptomyces sp. MP131-18 TaxID=1857892 RepID=UPI00097C6336|nr:DUF6531 domain-containing protein [Streptomyces sp. MP131-18]ONK14503.1 Cell wall-associated polypeptide CWBP200 [Streptomyces sp. MP131-18]